MRSPACADGRRARGARARTAKTPHAQPARLPAKSRRRSRHAARAPFFAPSCRAAAHGHGAAATSADVAAAVDRGRGSSGPACTALALRRPCRAVLLCASRHDVTSHVATKGRRRDKKRRLGGRALRCNQPAPRLSAAAPLRCEAALSNKLFARHAQPQRRAAALCAVWLRLLRSLSFPCWTAWRRGRRLGRTRRYISGCAAARKLSASLSARSGSARAPLPPRCSAAGAFREGTACCWYIHPDWSLLLRCSPASAQASSRCLCIRLIQASHSRSSWLLSAASQPPREQAWRSATVAMYGLWRRCGCATAWAGVGRR